MTFVRYEKNLINHNRTDNDSGCKELNDKYINGLYEDEASGIQGGEICLWGSCGGKTMDYIWVPVRIQTAWHLVQTNNRCNPDLPSGSRRDQ
jgi:hypothetical protein